MMLAGVLALALGMALAFFLEYRDRMKAYADYERRRPGQIPSLEAKICEAESENGGTAPTPSKDG
jgi:hypothetical protein